MHDLRIIVFDALSGHLALVNPLVCDNAPPDVIALLPDTGLLHMPSTNSFNAVMAVAPKLVICALPQYRISY